MKSVKVSALFLALMAICVSAFAETGLYIDPEGFERAQNAVLRMEMFDEDVNLIGVHTGILAFDNSTVVTGCNAIEEAEWIVAFDHSGNRYVVEEVLACDSEKDVSICKLLGETELLPVEFDGKAKLQRGEKIMIILGLANEADAAAEGEIIYLTEEKGISRIGFEATVSAGNGGILLDESGRGIGIAGSLFGGAENQALHISEVEELYRQKVGEPDVPVQEHRGPQILEQPRDAQVAMGGNAEICVKAVGDGLSYTWYASDVGDNDVYYQSFVLVGDTYSVKMDDVRNGRKVYCVITDVYGNRVSSDVAVLSAAPE